MAARELRLALAMRGGVSLAIWIGGACAEIDALRRAVGPPADPPSPTLPSGAAFWDRVGQVSGYDGVTVDVMAGASAGGLNGVLYAASQVYGFSMDDMRGVWAKLGDTQELLRVKRPAATWPSLFRGDDYFFEELEAQLRQLAADGSGAPASPPPLDLRLSATLVDPVRRPGRSPSDEQLVERRYSSGFRFVSPAYAWLPGQLPSLRSAPADGSQPAWSSRLALAARSTSSFPGAFEAAKISSTRPARFGEAVDAGGGRTVDMAGVLLDSGAPDAGVATFAVSDGGVLDNIPLGRALDAISQAPADGPTDRYLLYLQPGVPSVPRDQGTRTDPHRETAWTVLRGVLSSRMPAEDIIGDLQQLDRYNSAVDQAVALRRSTFAAITDRATLQDTADRTWDSYRVLRTEEDRRLVLGLLDDPVGTLGEDPFPREVGGRPVPDDCWRSPLDHTHLTPWKGSNLPSREKLAAALHSAFAERMPAGWPSGREQVWQVGVRPVLRVTQLLIEWAQHLEERGVEGAGTCKEELYRVATFVRVAVDRPRQLGWVTVAATHAASGRAAGTEQELVRTTIKALGPLVRLPADECVRIVTALRDDDTDELAVLTSARLQALDALSDGWDLEAARSGGPDLSDRRDLRVALVEELLVPVANRLSHLGGAADRHDAEGADGQDAGSGAGDASGDLPPLERDPGWYLDRAMTTTGGAAIVASDLAALEVVTFLEFSTGLPARRHVRLRRISSQSETPLAPHLHALLRAAAQEPQRWWDADQTDPDQQRGIHVGLKLAGDEAANFSAFLDERWRLNDWMWGRLDAVPTLLELLVTPASVRDWLARGDDEPLAAVEELVLGPEDAPDTGMRTFLAEHVWTRATQQAVREELAALAAGDDSPGVLTATRRALVSARQWEILATEPVVAAGDGSGPRPGQELLDAVHAYEVGAETFGHPRVRGAVQQRLRAIIWAAGRVASYNLVEHYPRRGAAGPPPSARRWGRRVRVSLQLASGPLARRLTR